MGDINNDESIFYMLVTSEYKGEVIDRDWQDYFPIDKNLIVHDYAPSIVRYNDKWNIWWCSLNDSTWDSIWYATSDDGLNWAKGYEVLESTPNTLDEIAVCDPSVIYVQEKWYMYYTGTRGPKGSVDWRNRIFVATADNPAGPWTKHFDPIIDVNSGCGDGLDQHKYCIGQSTVIYKDELFYHWYTDTGQSIDGYTKQTMLATSFDGINFEIKNNNKPVFSMSNTSIKYDKRTKKFFMIYGEAADNELFWNISSDGIHWDEHDSTRTINVYPEGCNHNPGIAGDIQGHINGATFVIYGQGSCSDTDDRWGDWQMDRSNVELY